MGHTPAPWTITFDGTNSAEWPQIVGPDGLTVTEVSAHTWTRPGGSRGKRRDFSERDLALSNARLIAAAPDLLEALKAVRMFIRNGIELGFICMPDEASGDPASRVPNMVDAAIAKAEG